MASPYRPEKYEQGDGTPLQWKNCVPSTGTMLMDRATVGRLRVDAWRIRALTKDTSGGITDSQLRDAVREASAGEVRLEPMRLVKARQVRDLVASGRALGIRIRCSETVSTTRATGRFMGLHEAYLQEFHWVEAGKCKCELRDSKKAEDRARSRRAHGEYDVADPGTRAPYQRWSAHLVHKAMYAVDGHYWVVAARDTEDVVRTVREQGKVRARPTKDSRAVATLLPGTKVHVKRTLNGGEWVPAVKPRADGWQEIANPKGYIKGETTK